MQNNLIKYNHYKPSGVQWLGDIPEHWELTRLGTRFEERRTKVSDKDYPALSVTKQGILPQLDSAAKTNDGDNRKLVKAGDFVINSRSDRKGSSGISDRDGSVSLINIVLEPHNVHPIFCNYLLKSYVFVEEFYRMGHGIVADLWTTRYDEMKAIMVGIPPLSEQTAIAQFLDRKTAQIEVVITQKQRMIELLKERRQILIHQAVTRGLNPDVPMKDSDVEWIGEIPEHWEITQIKKIAQTTSGGTPPSGNIKEYYNGHIPWVRTTDLNNDELYDVPEKITDKAIRDTACKVVPINTVCVAMYGGPGSIGKHSILRFSATLNQALCGIIPSEKLYCEFLYYYVKFCRPYWMINAKGTRVDPNISQDEVRKMSITLPPKSEQIAIAEHIESITQKISTAIGLKEQEIEKLKEYKASLINSVVTGKVKVTP